MNHCKHCRHCQQDPAFLEIAETYRTLGEHDRAAESLEDAREFAKCGLSGEYCGTERELPRPLCWIAGTCGKAGRFFEPGATT